MNEDVDGAFQRCRLEAHGGVVEPGLDVRADGEHGGLEIGVPQG